MERKRAAFRGTWYPETKKECESKVRKYLKDDKGIIKGDFSGCIVPHAGWYFSGSIACRTIASLNQNRNIDAVAVSGLHMHGSDSPLLLGSGLWETPFGDIDIHEELGSSIIAHAGAEGIKIIRESTQTFPEENTIELQLPFIKYFFKNTPIVPLGVPPGRAAIKTGIAVFNAAKDLKLNIAVIGSTDLTHYGQSFGFTPVGGGKKAYEWVKNENDADAVKALIAMDADQIIKTSTLNHNMCCSGAAAATVTICKELGLTQGVKVEYASSYNRSPGDSFVGYTGILFQ